MSGVGVAVGILAVWRVTHLLAREDGPWGAMAALRRGAGRGALGEMLDCFLCLSVWVALPAALLVGGGWGEFALLWPALSGGAILLERVGTRGGDGGGGPPGVAAWEEDPEPMERASAEVGAPAESTAPGAAPGRSQAPAGPPSQAGGGTSREPG